MVSTPYGEGVVLEARASDYVVQLRKETWELAYGQRPTLYLAENNLTASTGGLCGGEKVKSIYGRGYVLSKRDENCVIVESEPEAWSLAYNQLPRMYLEPGILEKLEVQ